MTKMQYCGAPYSDSLFVFKEIVRDLRESMGQVHERTFDYA